jgi:hypothetical protein
MVFALADVGSFLTLFCRAAARVVELDDLREETTLDGRVVSVGASRPGKSDGCVVHTSRTILSNCFREPVTCLAAVKRSEVITDSARLYEELGDIHGEHGRRGLCPQLSPQGGGEWVPSGNEVLKEAR